MSRQKNKKQNDPFAKVSKKWFILAAVFLIFAGLILASSAAVALAYHNKVYPGVKLGNTDISGYTKQQLIDLLKPFDRALSEQGIQFAGEDKKINISSVVISDSPDIAQPLIEFNWTKTAQEAYNTGRNGNFLTNLLNEIVIMTFGAEAKVYYEIDEQRIIDQLTVSFAEKEKPPLDAKLTFENNKPVVQGEKSGQVFDYSKAIKDLRIDIETLDLKPIKLELSFAEPKIKSTEAKQSLDQLDKILAIKNIALTDGSKTFDLPQNVFKSWLEFQTADDQVVIGLNQEKTIEFLNDIAKKVNVPTKDAKLEFAGERVVEFQASQDGKKLNIEQAYNILNSQITLANDTEIALPVEVDPAEVATSDLNDLGIVGLLGRGTSNFSGSPVNRRHNIKNGVDTLNGILIKPGEEFSLIDALGDIDGANGYLQELVIKGDRTIPEYGGGLCQIGSTTFRAALWSGLPITARRNHSYRVRYYEPAGMDATIYDPAPDMKFINDTGHHILFIARMDGDDLYFEFYGTPDGRKVTIEPNPPAIYNITQPGPPRYIETDDLAPGEKRKVESAHPGADTYFKYTIEYPDGRKEEQDFYSHYVAWRETWLIGRDPNATSTASTTVETSEPLTISAQ